MSETENKRTLGPLYVGAQNDALFIIDRPPQPSNDYPRHNFDVAAIAKIYHSGIPGREEAYAELFAQAPDLKSQRDELLAAAEGADQAIKAAAESDLPDGVIRHLIHARNNLRTAIRNAKGGGDV